VLGDEPYQEAYAAVLARWPEGTTTRDVGGPMGTTRVTVCGPADAPPIVLLSGGGATGLVWFALAEHLAAADLTTAFRLYALDLIDDPGGSTRIPRRMAGPDVVVGWLDGVLDRLGLATTTVMGHSYGGWIALRYALDRPARVDRMVLLDPSDCVSRPRPAYVLRALPLILRARRSNVEALLRWETSGELPDAQGRELSSAAPRTSRRPGSSCRAARSPNSSPVSPRRPWCSAPWSAGPWMRGAWPKVSPRSRRPRCRTYLERRTTGCRCAPPPRSRAGRRSSSAPEPVRGRTAAR